MYEVYAIYFKYSYTRLYIYVLFYLFKLFLSKKKTVLMLIKNKYSRTLINFKKVYFNYINIIMKADLYVTWDPLIRK